MIYMVKLNSFGGVKNNMSKVSFHEELIAIGGIKQYILHLPAPGEKPILLYIHGGPGVSCAHFGTSLKKVFGETATLVFWDQRGTGKTFTNNKTSVPSTELLLKDLHEVVEYLKGYYNKEKIIILGHSWGTVLGSLYALRHPENLLCYIGVGQLVCVRDNEKVCYEKTKEAIDAAGNRRDKLILDSLGEYPGDDLQVMFEEKLPKLRKLMGKYKVGMKMGVKNTLRIFTSPIFKFSDIAAIKGGINISSSINSELAEFDLREGNKEYKVPVFYVLGDRDFQTPYTIAASYLENVIAPKKKIWMIKDAGHLTPLDKPKEFTKAIKEICELLKVGGVNCG